MKSRVGARPQRGRVGAAVAAAQAKTRTAANGRTFLTGQSIARRAIDNRCFARRLKPLPAALLREVEEKLRRLGEI
jgi:hypothetical protein